MNNYRQTPRSRFIRKYQPINDPIYEENSMFERSRSVISTENALKIGNTSMDITSICNLTRLSVKAGLSHIYFDEKTLLFEE